MKLDHLIEPQGGWGWMPPTEEVFGMFRWCKEMCRPTNVLEIGFFVGHSTTYMLEIFEGCKVESFGQSKQYSDQARKMKELYGDRFGVHYAHSSGAYANGSRFNHNYDFALVDGDHSYHSAVSDMLQCVMLGIPYILVDNTDQGPVDLAMKMFEPTVDLLKTFQYSNTHNGKTKVNEARLYYVRTNDIQKLVRQPNRQASKFQVLP